MAYYCKYYNSSAAIMLSQKKPAPLLSKSPRTYDNWSPDVDIFETKSEIIAIIDLPGVNAEDIELLLEEKQLTIRGCRCIERPKLINNYRQLEINYGQFERILELPCSVTLGKAHITNGVLKVTLPKDFSPKKKHQTSCY